MASGDKKYDRNKKDCERYAREGRLAKNKARRMKRHTKRMARKAERRARWEARRKSRNQFSA